MVVPKIPIASREVADVRAQRDKAAARREAAPDLIQRPAERVFARQMLEEVAREDNVQRVVAEWPAGGAILLEKGHGRREEFRRVRVEVHREFARTIDVVDELAVTTAEIEHGVALADEACEKVAGQHLPHAIAVIEILREARAVDALKFLGLVRAHRFR